MDHKPSTRLIAGERRPPSPAITQKLELETRAGAYLFPSKFLLSRISGDCACPARWSWSDPRSAEERVRQLL